MPVENPRKVGQLKIFFGYAPACGKTYAMLDAALRRKKDGAKVIVGCLDASSQPLVVNQLTGVMENDYHAADVLDIDRIRDLHPDLVIVDDLSARNPEGSRHPRRYQDVEELLEIGCDVFSTLDISELESFRDAIWQCNHQRPLLQVPDRIFDQADVIEFIDLPPEELIQRLMNQPGQVKNHNRDDLKICYSLDRLRVMRGAALRRVAGRIQSEYLGEQKNILLSEGIPLQNRILVCVSSHPLSERLVRAGKRMADELPAGWVVLNIETPDRISFLRKFSEQLQESIILASELGAEVITIPGNNIAEDIIEYAKENGITRIILGNPKRNWWQGQFGVTLVDKVLRQSGLIDIYVISDEREVIRPGLFDQFKRFSQVSSYIKSLLLVILATLISYPLHFSIEPTNLVMIYLSAVVTVAIFYGRGPSIMVSVISVLTFDFFLIEPKLSLTVADTQYLITLLGFFVVSIVISNLASTIRTQVEQSRLREARTNAIYNLSRRLTTALDTDTIYNSILNQVQQTFLQEAAVFITSKVSEFIIYKTKAFNSESYPSAIIRWVIDHNQQAGIGTATYPTESAFFLPLRTGNQVFGVLAIQFSEKDHLLSTEKKQILEAYAAMAALAIERARLSEQANLTRLSQEKEKFQTTLLNSISHDLRTPLATITGVLSTLQEIESKSGANVGPLLRMELINSGWDEADRLNRLVGNLLDMTRLESGAIRLRVIDTDVMEVIGSVLFRMKKQLEPFSVKIAVQPELPLIPMDTVLIEQVLVNMVDNAIKFSEDQSEIEISAQMDKQFVMISVTDHGKGIPLAELQHVFDKFYRGKTHERISGTGLGLAISKGLVEIHGGKVWAKNLKDGGVQVGFSLPLTHSDSKEGQSDG